MERDFLYKCHNHTAFNTIVASSAAIFQRFPLHTYCGRTSEPCAFFRHGVTHGVLFRAMWFLQMFCNCSVIYYEVEGH